MDQRRYGMKDRNGVCVLLEAHVRAHSTAVLLAKVAIIKFNKRARRRGGTKERQ